jgi:hypothetical protein
LDCRPRRARGGGDPRCPFILPDADRDPCRPRFCGAPAIDGSPYCRRHHALCSFSPASAEGGRAARRLEREADRASPPPDELAYLASIAAPELDSADEPDDLAACLDLVIERPSSHE